MGTPWTLTLSLTSIPTAEQQVEGTLGALLASVWAFYETMCTRYLVGLPPGIQRLPDEDVRRTWAQTAVGRVLEQLPADNPYRMTLEKYAADHIDDLIRDSWTRN